MPRNLTGGKNFKKGRKVRDDDEGPVKFSGREEGQNYARVIRALGNRRMACFCNDGVERICKVRGTLCWGPRKVRIEAGDIIIYSLRAEDGMADVGDIIDKIQHKFWRDVRKELGIHPHLFLAEGVIATATDIIFEADGDDSSEQNEDETDSDVDVDAI